MTAAAPQLDHGWAGWLFGAEAVVARFRELGGRAPHDSEEAALDALLADPGEPGAEAGPADVDPGSRRAAATVLDEVAQYLGVGIGNLVNLINPELIVLGGWAGLLLGPQLLPGIREAAARHALHHPFGQVRIVLGELGPDAVARGAATLPVERFLAGGGTRPRSG
ncbi:hypothetical protein GCM10009665_65910 [Kitasatospora nipponensis]|uniref:ROK family protein n=1 Tax=Kitasatospora nipponensis TaxID=258049 RepID=A0ABP4HI73_9ACTN